MCQADYSISTVSGSSKEPTITSGPPGSPEKIVLVYKDLIPKHESYSPSETICVFVEIQFYKYKLVNWKLKNLIINELIDRDLELDNNSIRWAIISKANISDLNKYKNNLAAPELKKSSSINWINDYSFGIVIPNEIESSSKIVYWYNISVKKTGIFDLNTIITSDPEIGIYSNVDKSLRLYVNNYDFITPSVEFLKELVWIIIVFSGIFTFYKHIIQRPNEENYHLTNFFLRCMTRSRD